MDAAQVSDQDHNHEQSHCLCELGPVLSFCQFTTGNLKKYMAVNVILVQKNW